jgi:hypothetical protein
MLTQRRSGLHADGAENERALLAVGVDALLDLGGERASA